MPFDYDTSVKHEEIVSKFDAAKRDNKRVENRFAVLSKHLSRCKHDKEHAFRNEIRQFSKQYAYLEKIPAHVRSHLTESQIESLRNNQNLRTMNPEQTNFYQRLVIANRYLPRQDSRHLMTDDRLVKFSCHQTVDVKFLGSEGDVKADQYLRQQLIQRRIRNCRTALARASSEGNQLCNTLDDFKLKGFRAKSVDLPKTQLLLGEKRYKTLGLKTDLEDISISELNKFVDYFDHVRTGNARRSGSLEPEKLPDLPSQLTSKQTAEQKEISIIAARYKLTNTKNIV
ncbi:uncharacterized protein LOC142353203 [Convolutriloba macropyga]|uniref:uncharacterized protein LOC142353203 n=1 Tax=Convolutriloba macropyga TaxID=536237 RepID=UPI003F51BD89